MISRLLSFLVLTSLLAACQHAPDPRQHQVVLQQAVAQGYVVRLADGARLSPDALLSELAAAQVLIVGEDHDNLRHHQIEEWLVRTLPEQRPAGSYVLEMARPSQQSALNELQHELQTQPVSAAGTLRRRLDWQDGWPWPLYGNLVIALLSQPQPVLAGNFDTDEMRQIMARQTRPQGALSERPAVADTLAGYIGGSHAGIEKQMPGMIAVQMWRDRRMADTLIAAPKPSVLFAGNIHALKDVGVAMHLRDQWPDQPESAVRVLLLLTQESDADTSHADYLWITG
ncbi:ChaN family lipoprotein [Corticimicrobacter populi]|uniref:Haem-binding uptake Tiki superfamily ChaN domain-containing protein n=1 Tax=Corticimicrobacter populi TaxID=2175229 RepID=A0A2V1K0S6_9BURK|nr:ChaN family lipoprotein [Corticimicrobacter populi]PWF24721.1 hypothetical protein DD235_00555 [Corticimicrobacter populi]